MAQVEDLLRELAPQALGTLVRRHGAFDDAEDAVQEALLEAAQSWPTDPPRDPRAWLVATAHRRLIDHWRSESARRSREDRVLAVGDLAPPSPSSHDDSLELFLMCVHPALSPPSQVALTLRAVGGLTTAEIARAFLVPEATVAQRISRAKAGVRRAGATFALPEGEDLVDRVVAVAAVLYLVFTEGHTATSGPQLHRVDLTVEAIRLTRLLHVRTQTDPALTAVRDEVSGLLALMLLTSSRRAARVDRTGALVPLDEQDRSLWDRGQIDEGVALIEAALRDGVIGPYQLQAAIAAVHAEAASAAETDWVEILELYDLLRQVAPGPMVTLNRVVALAMAAGERIALVELDVCAADPALAGHHRVPAVRAHLLERLGDLDAARADYTEAARLTSSEPERVYLLQRVAALGGASTPPRPATR